MTREDQENRVCLQEGTSTSQALFLAERVDGDLLVLILSAGQGCPLSLLHVKAAAPGGIPQGSRAEALGLLHTPYSSTEPAQSTLSTQPSHRNPTATAYGDDTK